MQIKENVGNVEDFPTWDRVAKQVEDAGVFDGVLFPPFKAVALAKGVVSLSPV